MVTSPKVSVGPTTIVGGLLGLAQLLAGVALLVYGKTTEEKQAGAALIATGGVSQVGVLAGRMAQAVKLSPKVIEGAESVLGAALPTLEEELDAPPPVTRPESAVVPDGAVPAQPQAAAPAA